ncbi:TPA: hypothetical protein ACPYU1_001836 [Raoultella planticola]
MKTKCILTAGLCIFLAACSDGGISPDGEDSPEAFRICQGLSCSKSPTGKPGQLETYKPTREERNRIQRGESPNFGAESISIGGTLPW